MKRIILSFLMIAALGTGIFLATRLNAQGQGGAPAPAPNQTSRDVCVFNMAKVQKEFKKWESYTKELQILRTNEAKKLAEIQAQVAELKRKLENPTEPQKENIEKQLVTLSRQFQDLDAEVRKKIDKASTDYLFVLHDDIKRVVEAVAKANNYGLAFAYPDATTDEERKSPVYFDMKLRPTSAMPFYVGSSNDVTDAVIATLNKYCPPPTGSSVVPASGTTGAPVGAGATGAAGTAPRP